MPRRSKRSEQWQQQAEDNVLERLQNAGLLAPAGDVDKVLQTVVNNLEVTNNIDLPRPVRTRVLLTSPLETFSVGNTIVISRGLIDVLPDEASLAMVLSHELAHIVLGHNLEASTPSMTACCSPTTPPSTTWDSVTFPPKKPPLTRKPWKS